MLELLRKRLLATLAKKKVLPERKAKRLQGVVTGESKLIIDATERAVGRSIDYETQKEQYSGKKSHSVKKVLLAATDKRILYLSDTYEGSVHDRKIAHEADLAFEKTVELLQDSGLQGLQPKNAIISQPVKKPRTKELTNVQKQENKTKATLRVVVEHAINQVKVWRIVKEKIRSYRHNLRDEVMLIACALNNFKIKIKTPA